MSAMPPLPSDPADDVSSVPRWSMFRQVGPALVVVVACLIAVYVVPGFAALRPWKPGEPVPFWNVLGRPFEDAPPPEQAARLAAVDSLADEVLAEPEDAPPTIAERRRPVVAGPGDTAPRYEPLPEDGKPAPQPLEFASGDELDGFFAALARSDGGNEGAATRIVHWGDSSIGMDGIPGAIRRRMQQRFGDGGAGFHLMTPPNASYLHRDVRFRHNGEWEHCFVIMRCRKDGHYGLGGVVANSSGGAQSTFSPHAQNGAGEVSRFELWYAAQPGGGRIRLRVDRDEPVVIDTSAESLEDRWHAIDVEPGPHKLEVRALGRTRVYGVTLDRAAPGVTWDAISWVGSFTNRLLAFDAGHLRDQLAHREADLVVLSFGGNDMIRSMSMDEYEAEYRRVLRHLKQARPEVGCLVMSPLDHGIRKGVRIESLPVVAPMVLAQREAALAEGCAFFDTFAAMGGEGSAGRWFHREPRLMGGDLGHASAQGHRVIGEALYRAIVQAYVAYRRRTDAPISAPPR